MCRSFDVEVCIGTDYFADILRYVPVNRIERRFPRIDVQGSVAPIPAFLCVGCHFFILVRCEPLRDGHATITEVYDDECAACVLVQCTKEIFFVPIPAICYSFWEWITSHSLNASMCIRFLSLCWKLQMMAYEVFHACLQDVDTVLELEQGM